jgi:hypothetical protein
VIGPPERAAPRLAESQSARAKTVDGDAPRYLLFAFRQSAWLSALTALR